MILEWFLTRFLTRNLLDYAQALGNEVIICCREAEFHSKDKRPHFDISQKSMIVWKDEEELITKLMRRIEATVSIDQK